MEILGRLDSLLSPTLFITLAGLSLTAAALLYVAVVRRGDRQQMKRPEFRRLSELQPREYRGTGYLVVAFGWFMFGFISFSFFRSIGAGTLAFLIVEIIDKIATLLLLFLGLCFLYAGAGDLLRVITNTEGGVMRYLFKARALLPLRWLQYLVDNLIVRRFGDFLTRGLFRG